MHRVLNVKHRIVRRVDVGRAPLATFDTVDLGDEDGKDFRRKSNATNKCIKRIEDDTCSKGRSERGTIGGNHSKKALSQAGGEGKEEKAADQPKESEENNQNQNDTSDDAGVCKKNTSAPETNFDEKEDKALEDQDEQLSKSPKKESEEGLDNYSKKPCTSLASSSLTRQGTIGRVNIPIKKQSSISSSSSSEACNDSHFTFTTTRPSIAHLDSAEGGADLLDSPCGKSIVSNLVPDNIDPKQILSPSKRKAYEKRLERLKVTTSPIARPRSNAPINVVTLDEYANLSSPEASPLPHSILQDKLKITLPCDEFNKSSKFGSARRKSEDNCFEFSEEILFRCTKSALVVDEDGHFPISPRRVLIPPTITPTNSPKLSSSPRISGDKREEVTQAQSAPKLIYMKEDDTAHKFFGLTFDEPENDNWADFPDSSLNFEKADTESSEKDELNSTLCSQHQESFCEALPATEELFSSLTETDKVVDIATSNNQEADKVLNSSNSVCAKDLSADLSDHDSYDLKDERNNSNKVVDFPLSDCMSSDQNTNSELNPQLVLDAEELVETSQPQTESCLDQTETVNIPYQDFSTCSAESKACDSLSDKNIISTETSSTSSDVLIQLSNSFTDDSQKSVSFVEASPGDVIVTPLDYVNTVNVSSLLDSPSDPFQDETSIILPMPVSSSDILPTPKSLHTHTSSTSLNPFLQDASITPTFLDATDAKDIEQSSCVNVEPLNLQVSSPGTQLCLDSTISAAKSSSSSTDLIDFSSSLDLDLPPPPPQ